MKNIITDNDFLSEEDKENIETHILNNGNFSWYLNNNCVEGDGVKFLYHVAIKRPEDRGDEIIYNSVFTEMFLNLLHKFCKKHSIKYNQIMRCCVNLTFFDKIRKGVIHKDHTKKHKVLIIYLDDNKDCPTDIFDNKKKLIASIPAIKFTAVYFENLYHRVTYPKKGIRRILIFTFK